VWPLVIPLLAARNEGRSETLASPVESTFLALQAVENLVFPALPDSLNPHRREVNGHPVLEAGAKESVDVRVGGSALLVALVRADRLQQLERLGSAGPAAGLAGLVGGWRGSEELVRLLAGSRRTKARRVPRLGR
jgi:hypothetical protein